MAGASRQPNTAPDAEKPSISFKSLRMKYPKKADETWGQHRKRLSALMKESGPPAAVGVRKVFIKDSEKGASQTGKLGSAPWATPRR